tara:strand:- start:3268 stop:3897 length:630 start_codon:yes stop_codon:yes gene_type:complete
MIKYKNFYRKSSFKKDLQNGKIFLDLINEYKPKNFLEVGVLEGVTARNVCDLLFKFYGNNFRYVGIDLFGLDFEKNNIKEFTPISYNYSNPFKYFYHKFFIRKNPNTLDGVKYLLKKYEKSVNLYKGYSQDLLNNMDLSLIDFCFLDGGHSYDTVKSDLLIILKGIKKNSLVLVDDYNQQAYGVKKAVDEIKNKYQNQQIGRFMLIRKN